MTAPRDDDRISDWLRDLGLPGLIDLHTHFLPQNVLDKVWAYFDNATEHYGMRWDINYRHDEPTRVRLLSDFGVRAYAPLVYAHKAGMAEWLNGWVRDFAERTQDAVPTATIYPEPGVGDYLARALGEGARCVKMHVQVGGFDPRDPLLDHAWGLLAETGVPVVVHCGHGPTPGRYTGLDVFEGVLRRHPGLTAVLAHAGMPDYLAALALVERYPQVHLDTTMVGTAFSERFAPLPKDWAARVAAHPDRIVLGTDYPNIPYQYADQLAVIADWAGRDPRLGKPFLRAVLHDTPAKLLGLDL
ncbi:amidohydrolase family protein [Saccharopolyspora rhizosphaerae]|uniref:amidohydrolase family protein n=1 Tax=Saccharopolyspora rhizosphaerae TaxID=2492662 RepID=UPI0018F6C916|nr:amidohydrolase family protein [Saccharopolyspora rhizosphaerae]